MSNLQAADENKPIIIRVGVPAWGMPSWDVRSLQLLFLLHFNDVPHTIEYERYGYSSSTGDIPAIEPGDGTIVCSEMSINIYSDQLDNANLVDSALAYRILCETRMLPVCHNVLFEDECNFNRLVYGLFSTIPFPFCTYLPRKLRRKMLSRLRATTSLAEDQRFSLCENALQVCESKLETDGTPFLLGPKPCSGDAALCAFLMFAKFCPIESPDLKKLITPVLSDYIDQVLKAYPKVAQKFEILPNQHRYRVAVAESRSRSFNSRTSASSEEPISPEELARKRGNRIAIGVAAIAFTGFIFLSGVNRAK